MCTFALTGSVQATPRPCQPLKGQIVVARSAAVVVSENRGYVGSWMCHRASGRRTLLQNDPSVVRIAGTMVAFSWDSPEDDCGYGGLDVADARSGRQGAAGFRKCGFEHQFRPCVVKSSGAVAWMDGRHVRLCRVCFTEDDDSAVVSTTVTLARGPDVARHSLRGTRRGIVWRQAGHWRGLRLK